MQIEPVGFVESARAAPEDDFWGGASARIVLAAPFEAAARAARRPG